MRINQVSGSYNFVRILLFQNSSTLLSLTKKSMNCFKGILIKQLYSFLFCKYCFLQFITTSISLFSLFTSPYLQSDLSTLSSIITSVSVIKGGRLHLNIDLFDTLFLFVTSTSHSNDICGHQSLVTFTNWNLSNFQEQIIQYLIECNKEEKKWQPQIRTQCQ